MPGCYLPRQCHKAVAVKSVIAPHRLAMMRQINGSEHIPWYQRISQQLQGRSIQPITMKGDDEPRTRARKQIVYPCAVQIYVAGSGHPWFWTMNLQYDFVMG